MAKKKMTKAQAAAARKEVTPQSIAKARQKEEGKVIRANIQRAQKEASRSRGFGMAVAAVIVIAVVIGALVFTIAPGLFGR